jgi:hypothetical protein
MKRRKRTSDDGSLPVVTKRSDGKFAVELAPKSFLVWWMERHRNDHEHYYVRFELPAGTPIHEVPDGAEFLQNIRH